MKIKILEIGFHLCSLPGNASNKSEPPHECLVLCHLWLLVLGKQVEANAVLGKHTSTALST